MCDRKSQPEKFYETCLALIDLIKDLIIEASDKGYNLINTVLLDGVYGYISDMDKNKLIENFIFYSYQHWDEIFNKNEKFFSEHSSKLFGDLPLTSINAFKDLFELKDKSGNPVIIDDDKNAIWKFFHSLVRICIIYINNEKKSGRYQEINIAQTNKIWSIKN